MQAEVITRSEFARRLGVSAARVSQVADERLSDRARAGRKIVWPQAELEWRQGRDPGQALRDVPPAPEPEPIESDAYRDARTRAAQADAERKEMELARAKGLVIDRREVEEAMVAAGRRIRSGLERLENGADAIAEACGADVGLVRGLLRQHARRVAEEIATAMTAGVDEDAEDA